MAETASTTAPTPAAAVAAPAPAHTDDAAIAEDVDFDAEAYDGDELDAIRARMKMMEEEAAKLRELQAAVPMHGAPSTTGTTADGDSAMNGTDGSLPPGDPMVVEEAQEDVDARSVYVGNVDYKATPTDISNHFAGCGGINRVTIICDKFSGHPKGYCYIEFSDPAVVQNAVAVMDNTNLLGRTIKVVPKRTNVPGFMRGRGRGRGGYRGGYVPRGRGGGYSPYGGRPRGRGGFRGM